MFKFKSRSGFLRWALALFLFPAVFPMPAIGAELVPTLAIGMELEPAPMPLDQAADSSDSSDEGSDSSDEGEAIASDPEKDLFSLGLEELRRTPVTVAELDVSQGNLATLTAPVSREHVPAAITRITHEMIRLSGARSLNELFDIYVPNVQVIRHGVQPHVGIRGVISDREDKYLFRVNGRIMNQRTQVGAISERDLPMLTDIDYIDVVRGAGSAVYGPGAISGVVNIVTLDGTKFQGLDITGRQGFEENFTSAEIRYGRQFDEDSGLFGYYGFGDYVGADQSKTPYVFGSDFTTRGTPGASVVAGEPVTFPIGRDGASADREAWHKAHVQYTRENLNLWARYTKGGELLESPRAALLGPPTSPLEDVVGVRNHYQQLTVLGDYFLELTPHWNIDFTLSWDLFDLSIDTSLVNDPRIRQREDEYLGRVLSRWTPNEKHSFAAGFEYSHEKFGLPSWRHPGLTATTGRQFPAASPWSTDTYSFLAEHQWHLTDRLTSYLSARTDDHTYSDILFSPRIAAIYAFNEDDVFKFIASQSVRREGDDALRGGFLASGTFGSEEILQSLELRYESQASEPLWWGTSLFYIDTDAVGWNGLAGRSELLGNFKHWGVELESVYRTDRTRFRFSHAFTKLSDADVLPGVIVQGISAAPYGFGHDLANWSNNLTKLSVDHDLNCCTTVNASLRVYWGFPGGEALALYNNSLLPPSGSLALSAPGYKKSYRENVYLNFGIDRRLSECFDVRLDFYNVLGWFDKDLNKRNYLNRLSEYRSEAAAIGLQARCRF